MKAEKIDSYRLHPDFILTDFEYALIKGKIFSFINIFLASKTVFGILEHCQSMTDCFHFNQSLIRRLKKFLLHNDK